jgi:deoxyribodipyrimidine photo-lyase
MEKSIGEKIMTGSSIEATRIKELNQKPIRNGECVLYWMQQSQRAEDNPALEYAIDLANRISLPVRVVFYLITDYPEANARHFTFMLEGLVETRETLRKRGIPLVIIESRAGELHPAADPKAAAIVVDRGYLRRQRLWRKQVAEEAVCRVIQVEGDVVVPVETASTKAEYGARFIRPKIHKHLDTYVRSLPLLTVKYKARHLKTAEPMVADPMKILKKHQAKGLVSTVSRFFKGGTSEAKRRFSEFMENHLADYDENSNQPQTDAVSHMGPYLHFGQISPVYLARQVLQAQRVPQMVGNRFLEELVVRRELAVNFVYHQQDYDRYACIPSWAKTTLRDHAEDSRPYLYAMEDLEAANTHDPYWNAAMKEMVHTGFMHNYMRMYWAKKILEWTRSPEEAYETTLFLNNKYFLDGRDPNSYAGVAWCYGRHDRAWQERAVFGKVRAMVASGLERKCDIKGYVKKVEDRVNG